MRRVLVWLFRVREGIPSYLLLEKTNPKTLPVGVNHHQPVTGHCHDGEPFETTALREVEEETGIPATPDDLVNLGEFAFFTGEPVASFGCRVEGEPDIRLSKEHRAFRWLTFEEIKGVLKGEGAMPYYLDTLTLLHGKKML